MEMEQFDQMFTLLTAIIYAYLMLTAFSNYFRLRKEPILFESKFLCPARCEISTCLDPDGYVEYIRPKMLLTGILCAVCLVYEVVVMLIPDQIPAWLIVSFMFALPMAFVIYLGIVFHIGSKRYW